jgi:thioesterase domain-containing protein
MTPSAFVVLDRYPVTPAGKIDRARLPAPALENAVAGDHYAAPSDDTERLLCPDLVRGARCESGRSSTTTSSSSAAIRCSVPAVRASQRRIRHTVPLGLLFEAPTVRKLAEYLRSSKPLDGCVSLVAITTRSSRAPLFAIGGVGGNVLGYADLARALGPEQGFYAFQSVGLDGSAEPLESIEAMAQLYLSEMRSVQPNGPYALVGACFGATVAYEMARRLTENGEEVAFLGLLDPTSVGGEDADRRVAPSNRAIGRAKTTGRFFASRLQLYRRQLHELSVRERVVYVAGKLRMLLRRASGRASFEGVRLEMNLMKVQRANIAALRRFVRKPIAGHVNVLAVFTTPRRARAHGRRVGNEFATERGAPYCLRRRLGRHADG